MKYCHMDSPLGTLVLAGSDPSLALIELPTAGGQTDVQASWARDDTAFEQPRSQLKDYFEGRRTAFELVLEPKGTPFQLLVWQALRSIPYGCTCSYAEIARTIGRPRAARAVGAANGRNPIPIVVPCHRVIGADGSLTGFGGGLPAKRYLLDLESGHQHLSFEGA